MLTQKKIGFWSVTSLVVGSQIGSGIFLLPASLSLFGGVGLVSWIITAAGALCLAFVFSKLCAKIPKTGGPHVYIEVVFGKTVAFFCAWTYWVIAWLSSTTVLIAIVGYLTPILGNKTPAVNLSIEVITLLLITLLNLRGVSVAGRMESCLTLLKVLPFLIIPLIGLFFIKVEHFFPFNPTNEPTLVVLNAAALLTLWGFIGVESATAPAGATENPSKTIPKAILTGTLIVAFVYILNSSVVMGIVPPTILVQSKAPYSDVVEIMFGGNWHILISTIAVIVCFGTLNAWRLTSGQVALGAANDGLFPDLFKKTNANGAPIWSLIISAIGTIPFLILTLDIGFMNQVIFIIDIAVTGFLLIYVMSVLSYLVLFWKTKKSILKVLLERMIGAGALFFCGWALWSSGIKMIALALIVSLSGIPVYIWQIRKTGTLNSFKLSSVAE